MKPARLICIFALLVVQTGCLNTSVEHLTFSSHHSNNIEVDEGIKPDSALQAVIKPYAEELKLKMDRVLTTSIGEFRRNKPEGTLGNLVADIMRRRASLELGTWVDMSVTNNAGLRSNISKGPVRVEDIYAVMPFENTLVVLTLKGSQIEHLAREIAQKGGEPVSGLRMAVKNNRPTDILLGSRTLTRDSLYLVATNSYLADGGSMLNSLTKPVRRIDTRLTIRQIIIDALEHRKVIEPEIDYRIRD